MKAKDYVISSEKFNFVSTDKKIHDQKLETKPVGYLKDAFYRFRKNKASIVAAIIIIFLLLFAALVPALTPYTVKYNDSNYANAAPRNKLCVALGIDFWDGCFKKEDISYETFIQLYSRGVETGQNPIKNGEYEEYDFLNEKGKIVKLYSYRLDSYYQKGVVFLTGVTQEEYDNIQKYQDESGCQVIYPITDKSRRPKAVQDQNEANFWYETKQLDGKTVAKFDENGDYVNIYKKYSGGKDNYHSKVRYEGEGQYLYDYAYSKQGGTYEIRVNYYEYYRYQHNYVLKDKIEYPSHLFGANGSGKDILTCLSSGARFSFILAILVASVNLFVGAIYGAIEGYYGGKLDLFMERFSDILSAVPFMIVISLMKFHFETTSPALLLFVSFFITGWIGMASRTRMQFYRFKHQEYVLAARTLGAKDKRIMFKHIFPTAIGTLITGSVLVIPSVIFSETSLTYLQIINLETGSITSVGTLLAQGQASLATFPHIILFPAIFISLLMLSFNLFGNGLRDAFNPSLRGTEE